MAKKNIEQAQICAITFQNAQEVNEYQWIGAGTGSLGGNSILIYMIFDRDTEDYYLNINNSQIKHFPVGEYDRTLDARQTGLAKTISSKIGISTSDAEKSIFAARALFEDEAHEINRMDFEHTYDNELGEINPSKFFTDKSEVINRIWIGIGMNERSDKIEIDLSTGSLNFDREALDEIRICAWSKFAT
tara:strand:- start:697 stop:1263 length:567 start_codon:yes stop_codon:yes gene_type:complete